jgi:hypothetical protein
MGERLPQGPLKLSEFLSPRIPPGRSFCGVGFLSVVGRSSSLEGEINAIHFLHRKRNEMKGDATTNTADK